MNRLFKYIKKIDFKSITILYDVFSFIFTENGNLLFVIGVICHIIFIFTNELIYEENA